MRNSTIQELIHEYNQPKPYKNNRYLSTETLQLTVMCELWPLWLWLAVRRWQPRGWGSCSWWRRRRWPRWTALSKGSRSCPLQGRRRLRRRQRGWNTSRVLDCSSQSCSPPAPRPGPVQSGWGGLWGHWSSPKSVRHRGERRREKKGQRAWH